MFRTVGEFVARRWSLLVACWLVLSAVVALVAPTWNRVTQDGDFRALPPNVPTRRAERLYTENFSRDMLGSNIVIVARRVNSPLQKRDWAFLDRILRPRLDQLVRESRPAQSGQEPADTAPSMDGRIVTSIRSAADGPTGRLLTSDDRHGALIVLELSTGFMDAVNVPVVKQVEELIHDLQLAAGTEQRVPVGLHLTVTGTATAGRDILLATETSGMAVELWTLLIVAAILFAVYRAPLLALIPLCTLAVAVHVALGTLTLLAEIHLIDVFAEVEVYVTIVLYAAGILCALLVIDGYRAELHHGATYEEAVAQALQRVGQPLAATLGTIGCSVGSMTLSEFGKFRQTGLAVSLGLAVLAVAIVTLLPALFLLVGRWIFWPHVRRELIGRSRGWIAPTTSRLRLGEQAWGRQLRDLRQRLMLTRPGTIAAATALLLFPLAVAGVAHRRELSYGLFSELSQRTASREGAEALLDHFSAGEAGPIVLLIQSPDLDFRSVEGIRVIEEFTRNLSERKDELRIADVRSLSHPLGLNEPSVFENPISHIPLWKSRAIEHYVGDRGNDGQRLTRVHVILRDDPFARPSVESLERLQQLTPQLLPARLSMGPSQMEDGGGIQLAWLGPSASIRDLQAVTARDQNRVVLVSGGSILVLLMLVLRRPATALFLVASQLYVCAAAFGLTYLAFAAGMGGRFAGLDWKVPMLLFVLLMAVGQGLSISLVILVREGPSHFEGVRRIVAAWYKSDGVLSACGIATAAVFAALLAAPLVGMQHLGFALASGFLLSAFIVRTTFVPAWLILCHECRAWLSAQQSQMDDDAPEDNTRPVGSGTIPKE